jgi:hypothetical protein
LLLKYPKVLSPTEEYVVQVFNIDEMLVMTKGMIKTTVSIHKLNKTGEF